MREIKKSFWDFIALTGTSFLAIPLMMISEAVQGRFLGPEKYGKVALIISVIQIGQMIGIDWLFPSITRFGKDEYHKFGHIRKTFTNFLSISVFIVLFIIGIMGLLKIYSFLDKINTKLFYIIKTASFPSTLK